MRKLFYAVMGLVALLIVAVIAVALFVDLNQYKGEIAAELEAATGREVTLGGDIHVTFWPSIGAAIEDVEIANAPGASDEPMLRAETIQAVVAITPLLSGEVQVESIRIVNPVLLVETLTDGSSNLTFEGTADAAGGTGSGSLSPSGDQTEVRIDEVEIVGGTVIYRDLAGGVDETIGDIALTAQARTLQGPFEADGSLTARGVTTSFAVDVGSLSRPTIPISLRLIEGDQVARLTFTGNLEAIDSAPKASGSLIVQADSLAAALTPLVADLSPAVRELTNETFELDAQVSAGSEAISLVDLALSLGDLRATGDAEVALGEITTVDIALSANQLDGDRLAAMFAGEPGAPADDTEGDAQAGGDELVGEDGAGDEGLADDNPMAGLAVTADIRVGAVTYQEGVIRQAHLIAQMEDGVIAVQQLSAGLPGGTSLAVTGELDSDLDRPAFRGQMELASDNIRAALDWLQIELPQMAAERLRRVDLFTSFSVEPGVVALVDMDLSIDSSRMTGSLGADWTGIPAVTANVALDRINLDAYIVSPVPDDGAGDVAVDQQSDGSSETATGLALPPMPEINADIKARVGALTYNGVAIDSLVLDGTLIDRRIDLRNFSADIADASVRAAGLIDPATTAVSVRYAIEAPNIGGLVRLLAIDLPVSPEDLGATSLVGSVEGDTSTAEVKQRLETALGSASADGTLSDVLGTPGFDGRLGLRSESYMRLVRAFGGDVGGARDSAIAFAADVDTDGNEATFNAVLEAVDATLRASGSVTGIAAAPSYDVRAKLEHSEFATLMAAVGAVDAMQPVGLLDLTITAEGDASGVSGHLVSSTIGPSTLNGTLEGNLEGERPYFNLRLAGDNLYLDPFLAGGADDGGGQASSGSASESAGGSDGEGGGSRWSSEPLDLAALRSLDGRAEITGASATLQDLTFNNPVIVATLNDGVLQLEQFRGGVFDGQIDVTGQLGDGSPNTVSVDFVASDVDAQQVLLHFADNGDITGRLYLKGSLNGSGDSERALIESLAGNGDLSMIDGVIDGFDLPKISERLDNLDNELAIASLMDDATSGGQTRFTEVEGTFVVTDGIVRSDDLRAIMEAGAARFTLLADLPRWLVDLDGVMELTEHENSPRILISLDGPIDNPNRVVDTRELQAFLVQRAVETAIRKYGDEDDDSTAGQLLNILTGNQPDAEASTPPVTEEPQTVEPVIEDVEIIEEAPSQEPPVEGAESAEDQAVIQPEAKPEEPPEEPKNVEDLNAEDLLNILTGNQDQTGGGDQPTGETPADEQPSQEGGDQPLNTETLLKDLLEGLGNN
ncbi:MAG: AsmA family protein [Pseudomonadota bacterium]